MKKSSIIFALLLVNIFQPAQSDEIERRNQLIINENSCANKRQHFMPDEINTVLQFLAALTTRDSNVANKYMHKEFSMYFPNSPKFTKLDEYYNWGSGRYRSVKSTYKRIEVTCSNNNTIVYILGDISGVKDDGEKFAGLRYVDRFVLENNKILRMDAWSDL